MSAGSCHSNLPRDLILLLAIILWRLLKLVFLPMRIKYFCIGYQQTTKAAANTYMQTVCKDYQSSYSLQRCVRACVSVCVSVCLSVCMILCRGVCMFVGAEMRVSCTLKNS